MDVVRVLAAVATAVVLLAGSLAGAFVALRAAPTSVERFVLGTAAVRVEPAARGEIDAYAPLVDWGVQVHPFRSPLAVRFEFRALDREAALASLRSGDAATRNVLAARRDFDAVVRSSLRRAAIVGGLGAVAGGLVAGALVGAVRRRRRWLPFGAVAGAFTALIVIGAVAADVANADETAFREPSFYARGSELPELLDFSEQLLTAGEQYTASYDAALRSLATLIAVGSTGVEPSPPTTTAIVASDLHSNRLVLPALARYGDGKTVYFTGDFAQLGTDFEQGIVPEIARTGRRVITVSGNHDSASLMRALVRAGATVLTRSGRLSPDGTTDGEPLLEVDGALVAGWNDALESQGDVARHRLEFEGAARQSESAALATWFDALPERPDIVLIHQHGLAHALLGHLAQDPAGEPVLILTGHDHQQHYHEEGRHVLVDGGTVGAGGPFAIGVAPAGFAQLHLADDGRLRALDLIEIEPVYGSASARRVSFTDAEPTIPLIPAEADAPE